VQNPIAFPGGTSKNRCYLYEFLPYTPTRPAQLLLRGLLLRGLLLRGLLLRLRRACQDDLSRF
jgi:hypothetical protein